MKLLKAAILSLMLVLAPLAPVIAQQAATVPAVTAPAADAMPTQTTTTIVTSTTPTIVIPWGAYVDQIINQIILPSMGVIIAGLITYIGSKLPAAIRVYVNKKNTDAVEQLLTRAVESGLNKVSGAAKGKTLTVDVASPVLASAAQFAIDKAPPKLVEFMGGPEGIKESILARLDLAPETSGTEVLAATPAPVK